MLLHLQNYVSVFLNFIFWPIYLGKRSLCLWNKPHFLRNSNKSLLSPHQNKLKSETRFCRRKTAEDDNANINVPQNIPCTFLLFKVSAFLQIFFLRKSKFWDNSKCLIFLSISTCSLIELEHPLKTSNKRANISLPIYFFNWSRTFIKNIK